MSNVITSLGEVTPAWLTAVLTRSGALTAGAVTGFDVAGGRGNWSENGVLEILYTADAAGERPSRLFLKLVDADTGDGEFFGPSEVDYYTRDYVDLPDPPLVRCYDGAYSAERRRYHLLLEDISSSHVPAYEKKPTLAYGRALAEAFAALHAPWWGDERLAAAGAPRHPAAHVERFVDIARPGAEPIIAHFGDELEPHWPALIRTTFASHPRKLVERNERPGGFTLIHGDAGEYNIMVPREGERPLFLLDRQPFDWSLTTWLGVYDLFYAIVLDFEIDTRRQLEMPLLRHYHAELRRRGIEEYSWEQILDDYRLMVAI